MIVVTGAAGFIGSCLVAGLNQAGLRNLILVDAFGRPDRRRNFYEKAAIATIDREIFPARFEQWGRSIDFVFHLGARTDTTEKDTAIFEHLNLAYSKKIWDLCTRFEIPLVYASSAATYGLGELGFEDRHDIVSDLKPLNPYGRSKNDFDRWALEQPTSPPRWAGLKFFNVYGPNEYHKGRMASVIFHTFRQIQERGSMRLFRSHNPDYKDGAQQRDFIYVKDVVQVCLFLMKNAVPSGLYNLGTGQARTFLDLVTATFHAMERQPDISFIDTPEDIRDTYQYFTEARMEKLRAAGYQAPFYALEEGINDYVRHYLMPNEVW